VSNPQVSYPSDAQPSLQMNHIDGPLLQLRCGKLHWLTLTERLQLWLNLTDIFALERKHWND
jgi:hypothetical protein